jgi:sulfate permease, SulP family
MADPPPLWKTFLPVADWLPDYERSWLTPDALAALTVWSLLVPEGMAYASLAGMPPETGLWTAPLALIGYAVFGTSRQLDVGPSSTVAVLSLSVVAPIAANDPVAFVALSSWLALIAAAVFVVFGLLRAGFIADFMSKPVLDGFIIGLAMTVAAGQLPKLLGLHVDGPNFFDDLWLVFHDLPDASMATLLVGAGSLAGLFLIDRFLPRLPGALVVMVISIIVVGLSDLAERGVEIIGEVQGGLPPYGIPNAVHFEQIVSLIPGALAIVIVGFAESVAVARDYAARHGYHVDASQEMIALGAANAGAGLSGGFVVDGSLSKTAAADGAGQRSQMASLVVAVLIFVTALWFTGLFRNLAEATLAAIVINAVWHLIDFGKVNRYGRVRQDDFLAGAVALVGVLLFGILPGLAIAVLLSLFFLVRRASRPNSEVLGRVDLPGFDAPVYRGMSRFPGAEQIPGLLIFRFDADLFFANAPVFEERLLEAVRAAPTPVEVALIDASTITDVDTTAVVMLAELQERLAAKGIVLWFARVHSEAAEIVDRADPLVHLEMARTYPTVTAAVADFEAGVR